MTAHDVVRKRITGSHLEGTGSPGFLNSVPVSDSQADVMKEPGPPLAPSGASQRGHADHSWVSTWRVFMRKAMDRTGANPPRCQPRVHTNSNGPAIGNEEGGHGILWKLWLANS
jgi:hypothetical protein